MLMTGCLIFHIKVIEQGHIWQLSMSPWNGNNKGDNGDFLIIVKKMLKKSGTYEKRPTYIKLYKLEQKNTRSENDISHHIKLA